MNPMPWSLATSSPMARYFSSSKALRLCLMGWKDGLMVSLCVMISGEIPGMSAYDHAKTAALSRRN
ncbi:hypothetical protein RchiOBHm_Chr1g0354241 [Rosa chinensis]|uniref:Uncharacterized protein n=1 Tax=Rosa chinensis TaxID=74649 RepID=A0A2P6SH28_ROSCH|nr:hypothetical protein RchiOBHm_Chr1g0354241 [Rosa chinensis]